MVLSRVELTRLFPLSVGLLKRPRTTRSSPTNASGCQLKCRPPSAHSWINMPFPATPHASAPNAQLDSTFPQSITLPPCLTLRAFDHPSEPPSPLTLPSPFAPSAPHKPELTSDVYRGGILADWYVPLLKLPILLLMLKLARIISSDTDTFFLSEQEDEENFDLSLISSLETDVIPCLGDDCIPDYLITQLAKVLQQGSQLLLNVGRRRIPTYTE